MKGESRHKEWIDRARALAFWLFWPALCVVVWGELTPHPPDLHSPDKLLHFLAYFGLSGLLAVCLRTRRAVIGAVLGLALLGGVLEILQAYTGRDAEVMDEVANILGAIMGAIAGVLLVRLVGGWMHD